MKFELVVCGLLNLRSCLATFFLLRVAGLQCTVVTICNTKRKHKVVVIRKTGHFDNRDSAVIISSVSKAVAAVVH